MFFTSPTFVPLPIFIKLFSNKRNKIYQLTIERVQDSVQKWVNLALLRIACIFKLVHRYQ